MREKKFQLLICSALMCAGSSAVFAATWPTWGNDLNNSRSQSREYIISPVTAGALKLKWSVPTDGDVTATPAVDQSSIYFPDSAGSLYRVDRRTGKIVWKYSISAYTGVAGDYARSTPALVNGMLILDDQSGRLAAPQAAKVFAVNATTGALIWATKVDSTTQSIVTQSPIVHNGTAYVGLASNEEFTAGLVPAAAGFTWHFRGSVVALNVATGAIKWQTYTVPEGYFGAPVWGSTGAVNPINNALYMSTGNNYWIPGSAQSCLQNGGSDFLCLDANDHFDSILALDLTTGTVKWARRGLPYDAWNAGCGIVIPGVLTLPVNDNCPNPAGVDFDFAQGPMLFNSDRSCSVGAGEKSGYFWTFDARTGASRWTAPIAPAGARGGLQWGSATDGTRIYVAVSNAGGSLGEAPGAWQLNDGTTVNYGGWAAVNPKTGAVLWTTPDPNGSFAQAAVSVANGVVFGCEMNATTGTMYALNASTGAVLWSNNSGSTCIAGASIADGVVYWGSGTGNGSSATRATGPQTVSAFSVNGL